MHYVTVSVETKPFVRKVRKYCENSYCKKASSGLFMKHREGKKYIQFELIPGEVLPRILDRGVLRRFVNPNPI